MPADFARMPGSSHSIWLLIIRAFQARLREYVLGESRPKLATVKVSRPGNQSKSECCGAGVQASTDYILVIMWWPRRAVQAVLQMQEEQLPVDTSTGRPSLEECLPRDVLEEVMAHMDRETLCTARLLSKSLCTLASANFRSLMLPSTSKAVSFHRFPHLEHVTVRHAYPDLARNLLNEETELLDEETSLAQLDPCLRDAATALTIGERYCSTSIAQTRDYLSQAALMPKLRKLEVQGDIKHEAALLARCTNLEFISSGVMGDIRLSVASALVTLPRLTSLHIGGVDEDDRFALSADMSWLEHATNLQALSITTLYRALPPISKLTGLTGLTLFIWDEDVTHSIAPLTRLTRLKSLSFDSAMTESNLAIACSLGSGSLVNLALEVCPDAAADCGRLLARQTALTQLGLNSRQLCNLRHIGALRIELLQCLEAHDLANLDAEGLSVLSRATALTRLSFASGVTEPDLALSQVLGRLAQLRSLWLRNRNVGATSFLDFSLALSPLTALTKLRICGHALDDGVMGALLGLTDLRVLEVDDCRLTPDEVPELGRLTKLSALRAAGCGVTSLAPVSKVLDPLRIARGLPPLYTSGLDL